MDLLNKVLVVGNLTRDPEVRETGNGKAVANLGLAVAQTGGAGGARDEGGAVSPAEPIFLDVVLWERMAENAGQYLKKGSTILLEGRLQMDTWQDQESGQTRRRLKISGERMRFLNLGPGRSDRDAEPASANREPQAAHH